MSGRWHAQHLVALLVVLLLVQAPRFAELPARLAEPVFERDRGFVDFERAYYPAGVSIRRGDPLALYRPPPGETDTHTGRHGLTFVNLPPVAALFAPLTLLPERTAGVVWLGVNVMLALACLLLVQQRLHAGAPLRWAVTLAFATSGPLLSGLTLGQTTLVALLALLLAERALARRRDRRAGMWLALASVVKVPLLVLLPCLAWRGRWRAVATFVAGLLALGLGSIALWGWPAHAVYVDVAFRQHAGAAVAGHFNQSLDGALARLLTPASLLVWVPRPVGAVASALKWFVLGVLCWACAWAWRRPGPVTDRRVRLELAAALCLALVALPVSWVHYGVWLVPVAVVIGDAILRRPRAERWTSGALLVLGVLLVNVPVPPPWIIERFDEAPWFRLAISHQLAGTLVLLGLCLWGLTRRDDAPATGL